MTVLIREMLEEAELAAHPDALRMDRAIGKLRDEVTGAAMRLHRGQNRNLSLVITKLDEAQLWAQRWLEETGQSTRVDRGKLLADGTVATDATVTSANERGGESV